MHTVSIQNWKWGEVWEQGYESKNAGLVPRPTETTLAVRLQLVSCSDPQLAHEPDLTATSLATQVLVNTDTKHSTRAKANDMTHHFDIPIGVGSKFEV